MLRACPLDWSFHLRNQKKTAGIVYIAVGLVLLVSVVFVPASLGAKLVSTVAGIFIVFMGWRFVRELENAARMKTAHYQQG